MLQTRKLTIKKRKNSSLAKKKSFIGSAIVSVIGTNVQIDKIFYYCSFCINLILKLSCWNKKQSEQTELIISSIFKFNIQGRFL